MRDSDAPNLFQIGNRSGLAKCQTTNLRNYILFNKSSIASFKITSTSFDLMSRPSVVIHCLPLIPNSAAKALLYHILSLDL